MQFTDLPLDHRILKNLEIKGFDKATDIQQQAIPTALLDKDILASSKTGSGKTLAFLIPAVNRLLKQKALSRKDPRALILAPTRELAKQVFMQLKWLIKGHPLSAALILGGENFNDQVKALGRNPQFIVGTAGRVADHLQDRSLYLNGLELLILDEADRMLDLGFVKQLKAIHTAADHRKRQTMMFSATLDNAELHFLTQTMLKAPQRISVGQGNAQHQDIEQRFIFADHLDHKRELVVNLLASEQREQAIVFTATREDTERLASLLNQHEYTALALSGDLKQSQRNQIMNAFGRGQAQVLVTTDVASRGLDLLNVAKVINFDLPKLADEYVHRIGRTGRAGNKGMAFSLVGPKDWRSFVAIRRFLQQEIEFTQIEGKEANFSGFTEQPPRSKKQTHKKSRSQTSKPHTAQHAVKRINTRQGQEVGDQPMLRRKKPEST